MPTLSVVRTDFIKVTKWAAIIIGIFLGLFLLIKGIFFIKEIVSPTPPPPPTVSFGKLPAVFFSQGIRKDFKYTIDTLSGELPVLPDRSKVYEMVIKAPDILAAARLSERAASIGFDLKAQQLSEKVYRWKNAEEPLKILVMNTDQTEFTLISNFLSDEKLFNSSEVVGKDEAISAAKSLLHALSAYPEDIDETKTKTEILKIDQGVILDATSISNTKLVTVYFFLKERDNMPIVYTSGKRSTINATVARRGEVIDARYFYQTVNDKSATYPIKTADEAFRELKKGKGHVASFEGNNTNIVIKNVYLAYFAPARMQKYLMPVIVFEGNDDFLAYVAAVKDEWAGK